MIYAQTAYEISSGPRFVSSADESQKIEKFRLKSARATTAHAASQ